MSNLKAITTDEIVEAIDKLIELKIKLAIGSGIIRRDLEEVEIQKRIIIDGFRFHSASHGIVTG